MVQRKCNTTKPQLGWKIRGRKVAISTSLKIMDAPLPLRPWKIVASCCLVRRPWVCGFAVLHRMKHEPFAPNLNHLRWFADVISIITGANLPDKLSARYQELRAVTGLPKKQGEKRAQLPCSTSKYQKIFHVLVSWCCCYLSKTSFWNLTLLTLFGLSWQRCTAFCNGWYSALKTCIFWHACWRNLFSNRWLKKFPNNPFIFDMREDKICKEETDFCLRFNVIWLFYVRIHFTFRSTPRQK